MDDIDIIKIREKVNQAYLITVNDGRQYRILGVTEEWDLVTVENAERYEDVQTWNLKDLKDVGFYKLERI